MLNNLGVVQVRRGATAETGKATYYFTQAAKAEPDEPDLLFNLGYAYALDRDPQGAIYWLRESLRRNPADGDAHIVLAAELDAAGLVAEAVRERELAAQLSAKYADALKRLGAEVLPTRLEWIPTGRTRRRTAPGRRSTAPGLRDGGLHGVIGPHPVDVRGRVEADRIRGSRGGRSLKGKRSQQGDESAKSEPRACTGRELHSRSGLSKKHAHVLPLFCARRGMPK